MVIKAWFLVCTGYSFSEEIFFFCHAEETAGKQKQTWHYDNWHQNRISSVNKWPVMIFEAHLAIPSLPVCTHYGLFIEAYNYKTSLNLPLEDKCIGIPKKPDNCWKIIMLSNKLGTKIWWLKHDFWLVQVIHFQRKYMSFRPCWKNCSKTKTNFTIW